MKNEQKIDNKQMMIRLVKLSYVILLLFFFSGCRDKDEIVTDSDVYYTCSMDPQVIEFRPGKCPVCKMEMTPVKKSSQTETNEIMLSDQQIRLGNITTDTIRAGQIGEDLVLTATLNVDQRKTSSVSARVMGRIEKLYRTNIGDYVKEGTPLYVLYSEDLNNAKQEYLLALDNKKLFSTETVIDFNRLIESSRNKLLLYGMSNRQIENLASNKNQTSGTTFLSTSSGYITQIDKREGEYVMEGETIIKLADLSSLIAETQVFATQLAGLSKNTSVTVRLPELNNTEIKGKMEFFNPEVSGDSRINLVRVSIPNTGNKLKPGMLAYVVVNNAVHHSLTLPIDGVIRDGTGSIVWISTGKNTFKHVMVKTGMESDNRIEILSGLSEGDVVVMTGTYLLHSEYIFKKGGQQMGTHQH